MFVFSFVVFVSCPFLGSCSSCSSILNHVFVCQSVVFHHPSACSSPFSVQLFCQLLFSSIARLAFAFALLSFSCAFVQRIDIMSFLHGNDFAILAHLNVRCHDTLVGVFLLRPAWVGNHLSIPAIADIVADIVSAATSFSTSRHAPRLCAPSSFVLCTSASPRSWRIVTRV